MIGTRPASAHSRGTNPGRSILRLLAGHGARERIRSFYVQMAPEEARRSVDQQKVLERARLPRGRAYAFEFIPAQGGCVVAVVPPDHNLDRPARLEGAPMRPDYTGNV